MPEENVEVPVEPEKVNDSWLWIRGSNGYASVTTTLVFVSFWVTTISFLLSMFEQIGPLPIRPFDVAACSAYLGMILATYVGRRWTEAKYESS